MDRDNSAVVDLALEGNHFSALSVLQHAQLHLMRPEGCYRNRLTVSLDGDFAAILKLQTAESDLLGDSMRDAVDDALRFHEGV